MEYKNTINFLDDTPNQPSKFKTKKWDELQGKFNEDNQIRLKNSMLRSSLCDYSDVYILLKQLRIQGIKR